MERKQSSLTTTLSKLCRQIFELRHSFLSKVKRKYVSLYLILNNITVQSLKYYTIYYCQ